jgi:hypothetical protein
MAIASQSAMPQPVPSARTHPSNVRPRPLVPVNDAGPGWVAVKLVVLSAATALTIGVVGGIVLALISGVLVHTPS